jgi:hypothetical protein
MIDTAHICDELDFCAAQAALIAAALRGLEECQDPDAFFAVGVTAIDLKDKLQAMSEDMR